MDKIISKNLSSKYSQKLLNHAKQYNLKSASTRAIQKTAEATGDLIGKITADKISRVQNTLPQNNSETNEEEIHRETYISTEKKHKRLLMV